MQPASFLLPGMKAVLESAVDKRDPSNITMSSLGHCARQLAYRFHCVQGTVHDWRAMMVFKDGDTAHTQLRELIVTSLTGKHSRFPCYTLQDQEKQVVYCGVPGHIDGLLKHDGTICQNPLHEDILLEVKSMNDRAFLELEKTGEIGFEYRCQVSGYLAAMKLKKALILAKNKNTGALAEYLYEYEPSLINDRVNKLEQILLSESPEEVEREYSPNKRGALPWQCGYCPFAALCWRHEGITEKKPHKFHIDISLYKGYNNADQDKEAPEE